MTYQVIFAHVVLSELHRMGSGDPALRSPGPGTPYPDPEFPPPAIVAINGTLAQQTGYCAGAPSFLTDLPCYTSTPFYMLVRCTLVVS